MRRRPEPLVVVGDGRGRSTRRAPPSRRPRRRPRPELLGVGRIDRHGVGPSAMVDLLVISLWERTISQREIMSSVPADDDHLLRHPRAAGRSSRGPPTSSCSRSTAACAGSGPAPRASSTRNPRSSSPTATPGRPTTPSAAAAAPATRSPPRAAGRSPPGCRSPARARSLEFEQLLKIHFADSGTKADVVANLEAARAWVLEQNQENLATAAPTSPAKAPSRSEPRSTSSAAGSSPTSTSRSPT